MARYLDYVCAECGKEFRSKPTGREHWQPDRFCSTYCGNKKRKRDMVAARGGRERKDAKDVR